MTAFHRPITAVDFTSGRIAICSDDGHAYIGPFPTSRSELLEGYDSNPGIEIKFGRGNTARGMSMSFQRSSGIACFACQNGAWTLDREGNPINDLSGHKFISSSYGFLDAPPDFIAAANENDPMSRCFVDWLDPNIVALNGYLSQQHVAMLWDTRTAKGVSSRFNVPARITGILSPSNTDAGHTGHQLIISTNHRFGV
jgi:hypothetical protein